MSGQPDPVFDGTANDVWSARLLEIASSRGFPNGSKQTVGKGTQRRSKEFKI
jgi:hypothetical protein